MLQLQAPLIAYRLEENFEAEYLRTAEYRKINPNATRFTTSEAHEQLMTKLAIDYSAQKVRGTVMVTSRVYDFETKEMVSTYTKKNVVHVSFHKEAWMPGESLVVG